MKTKPDRHKATYFYDGGTGMGDDREGYSCWCGWLVLGADKLSQREADHHEKAANR